MNNAIEEFIKCYQPRHILINWDIHIYKTNREAKVVISYDNKKYRIKYFNL